MAGALRYTSTAALPDRMRHMVEAQGKGAAPPARAPTQPSQRKGDPEHLEQVDFFRRIRELAALDASYLIAARRTFAIPNGGGRSKREAGRLKAEGVTAGVSDIFCSVAHGGWHGLYIEMKSLTGYASREQGAWITESIELGYEAATCRGSGVAFALWKGYVDAI